MSSLLPLFPLDVVLFPGTPLPLHIFEPRYKEMIGECLAQKKPFGVIRAQPEGIAEIGCTADIVDVIKRYPDGRLDIATEGRERFEVLHVNQERDFLQAEVLVFTDEPGKPAKEEITRALALHAEVAALAGAPHDAPAVDDSTLSFHLAASLPLDPDFKQKLLELRSEALRITSFIAYLESILPSLKRAIHTRQKAGGNGHGR